MKARTILLLVVVAIAATGSYLLYQSQITREALLVYSGNTFAFDEPCGCCSGQLGGLPRRANYLLKMSKTSRESTRTSEFLLMDTGNFTDCSTELDTIRTQYVSRAMKLMCYDIVNLGPREVRLQPDVLSKVLKEFGDTRIVSANWSIDKKAISSDNQLVLGRVSTFTRMKVGGIPFFITGAAGTSGFQSNIYNQLGIRLEPPLVGIKAALRNAGRSDIAVVLCCGLSDNEVAELWQLSRINIMVGLTRDQVERMSPIHVDNTENTICLSNPEERGRTIGEAEVSYKPRQGIKAEECKFVEMREEYHNNKLIESVLSKMDKEIGEEELKVERHQIRSAATEPQYAGSNACVICHPREMAQYSKTQHYRSMQTLVNLGEQRNPVCLKCHTTAFGEPTGFNLLKPNSAVEDVGCEVCHGPARDHTLRASAVTHNRTKSSATPRINRTALVSADVSEAKCLTCHTDVTSPSFRYHVYISKVRHN